MSGNRISKYKVNVGKKSRISVEWNDKQINYSDEAKKHIISIVSSRYDIPKEQIRVNYTPVDYNEKGEKIDMSTDVIQNIQDPKFQLKLFNDFINENKIDGVDFEYIKKIDSEINSLIDYDVYDKYRKYEVEWIKWGNFLSYDEDNYFDFRNLKGLTLVNGEPQNMSGKTTFAIDLMSFLLYGKPQKPYTLSECFNKFSDSNTLYVTGSIKIEGESYITERIITRRKKRGGDDWGNASQKVKYYRVINDEREELVDYDASGDNLAGGDSRATNKIIKESIGSEKDFNMIVSATEKDLDSLIDIGNTERGRLLSKWIGLLPLEEKEVKAKEKYKNFSSGLKSKIFNITDLTNENDELAKLNIEKDISKEKFTKRKLELDILIGTENEKKDELVSYKRNIDADVLKIDINTINVKMKDLEVEAKGKSLEEVELKKQFDEVKDVDFSMDKYKELNEVDKELSISINNIKKEIQTLRETNKHLKDSEACPTCKRKYENLDNSSSIAENKKNIELLIEKGILDNKKLNDNKELIIKLDDDKIKFDKKLKLQNSIEIIPVQIESLRVKYRECLSLIKKFNENEESIRKNNDIDIKLVNIKAKISSYETERTDIVKTIENLNRDIIENNKQSEKNDILIREITEELKAIKNWKTYLELVGKNGISKMVLKKTLPIINSNLNRMLEDVCDFEIEVLLTEKNDVIFEIIKDGVASSLGGASGFERTASGLALRHVLGNISTMPKPNFITLDEVLGKIGKEFYDNIRELYAKMEDSYQFILHITHIEDIKDWHKNFITITKKDNISVINQTINKN